MDKILSRTLGMDVSKLDEIEKQNVLSRLLGRLAHEIRNPLNSLNIHAQLLEEDLVAKIPDRAREFSGRLEIIQSEIRQLEKTVSQFVHLSGPSNLDLASVSPGDVVSQVAELLGPEAGREDVTLEVRSVGPSVWIEADASQLTQALINLVINAVQAAARPGRVELTIDSEVEGHVDIRVCDDGPGIPEEIRGCIFEPFFSSKSEGSGIGLWIARQVAVAHGGSLTAANTELGGAVFVLRLPKPAQPDHG